MRWQAEPSRYVPSDLDAGRAYSGRGFAMPLAAALAAGRRIVGTAAPPPAARIAGGGASLVIGGSGFLGARLVAALMRDGEVVVAARSPGALRGQLAQAFGDERAATLWADARLRTVEADLTATDAEAALARATAGTGIRTVYHLAARVHAFAGWEALRAANVDGTLVAARTAARSGARLQLASTLSVFVSSNGSGEGEETPLSAREGVLLYGGYAQTKAASEAVASLACGQDAQILRYGLLVPEDGARLAPDHFLRAFVEGLVTVGCVPDRAEESWVDLTPVDEAAAASVAVARSGADGVFHYANPISASLTAFVAATDEALAAGGLPRLEAVSAATWRERLKRLSGLRAAIQESAFDKTGFLAGAGSRLPLVNADLFQSTARSYGISRSLDAGAARPTAPSLQVDRLVRPLVNRAS